MAGARWAGTAAVVVLALLVSSIGLSLPTSGSGGTGSVSVATHQNSSRALPARTMPAPPAPTSALPSSHLAGSSVAGALPRESLPAGSLAGRLPAIALPIPSSSAQLRGETGADSARQAIRGPMAGQASTVCAGLFPGFPNATYDQSLYTDDCYGHDEPGIQFYSNLPGSGGNVTWTVTLPIDRSATQNQSNLYSAVWFGMTVVAPSAWLRECFVEVQFYPDAQFVPGSTAKWFTAATTTLIGNWVGAVYAWQLEAATGREIPCFYSPLYPGGHPGTSYFSMSQGDHVSVTMTGWPGSPTGENLTVIDDSNGQVSYVTMYNATGGYPVDPAYETSSWENALHWTPGGEYPVAFSFETGHAGNPSYPRTNPYGGCNPGPPSKGNPATPCPSYDPASWANDTLVPWHIAPPVFFNSAVRQAPAQVAFTSPWGGIQLVSTLGGGTCAGRVGSSWCSYPWYSYSCAAQGFEFGATDYPGVSVDFGQYGEYATQSELAVPGLTYYPPLNFSIPNCGGASYTVSVNPMGTGSSIYFLSTDYASPANLTGIAPGEYSIAPLARATGSVFELWATTGGAHIEGALTDPYATLNVQGNGTVTAQFAASTTTTTVTFRGAGTNAAAALLVVSPGTIFTTGIPIATVASGGTVSLAPGVYGIQAGFPSGTNFSIWTSSGAGAILAADDFPYTTLVITGLQAAVNLTATSTPATLLASVEYGSTGGGSVTFDGVLTSSVNIISVPSGTYPIVARPNPGYGLLGWGYTVDAFLTDFQASTNASVYHGPSLIEAFFAPVPYNVTLQVFTSPITAGAVQVTAGPVSLTLPNGGTVTLPSSAFVGITAVVPAGDHFTGWTTNTSATLWILDFGTAASFAVFNVTLVTSVSLTAHFAPAPTVAVTFTVAPTNGGWILFNLVDNYTGGLASVTNGSVSSGTYGISIVPASGWEVFLSNTSGAVSLIFSAFGAPNLNVSGVGAVHAFFAPIPPALTPVYAVTFVANSPAGASGIVNGTTLGTGAALLLPAGTFPIAVLLSWSNETFVAWVAGPGLGVADPNVTSTQLSVSGPGTIYAIIAPFGVTPPTVSHNPSEVGVTINFATTVVGGGTVSFVWENLPGCPASNAATLSCDPTRNGTFDVLVIVANSASQTANGEVRSVVNPRLSIETFSASASNPALGGNTTFLVLPLGGVWPLSYSYQGLPPGCSTANTSTLFCKPSAAGTYTITVLAVDTLGVNASATLTLSVTSSAGLILGLQPTIFYGLLVVGVVLVGVVIIALLLSRRRKAAPTPPIAAWAPPGATGGPMEPAPQGLPSPEAPTTPPKPPAPPAS